MQILITGGTGYLGSRLAKMLNQAGHRVLALNRAERELPSQVASADAVIHTACCYGRAGENDSEVFAANVDWPSRLLTMLSPDTLFLNTDTVLPPRLSSYAASKELFRQAGPALVRARDARWINLRLEHFYGPGEGDDKFITRTVRACLEGGELKLTPGEQRRDFIFIDDVVRAFDLVLRVAAERKDVDDLYAGTGKPVRIRDLAERIHRLCGSRGTLRFGAVAYREGEPMEIERPQVEPLDRYGWRAEVELQEGLEQVVQFEKMRKANPCVCS
jgi:nucleoside-diphosphate-sugar epimerase